MNIMTKRDVIERVRARMMEGWIHIAGSTEAISEFEDQVYPPGPRNAGLEVIMGQLKEGGTTAIVLAKKTKELARFLKSGGVPEAEIRSLFRIRFGERTDGTKRQVTVDSLRPGHTLEDSVSKFANELQRELF